MEFIAFLLILLIATRVAGEIAVRLGQPAMVGELLSGVILGGAMANFAFGGVAVDDIVKNEGFVAVTSLGAFFIMLQAGVRMRPSKIAQASRRGFVVAMGGLFLPLALGFGLGWFALPDTPAKIAQCLFLGTALSITAVAVSVRMLMDFGKLESRFGEIIVSAAIFDDILGLVLLAILTALARTGEWPAVDALLLIGGKVVLFFAIATVAGIYLFPAIGWLARRMKEPEVELGLLLITALAYAALAEALGMHFIIGAFIAGLFFGRRTINPEAYEAVDAKITGFTSGFLGPIFFAAIGFQADAVALVETPVFVAVLIALAFAGKMIGAGGAARAAGLTGRESVCVGLGMSSRGAVELVIADIALKAGLFTAAAGATVSPVVDNMFSAVVLMAVVTTIAAPVLLRMVIMRSPRAEDLPDG